LRRAAFAALLVLGACDAGRDPATPRPPAPPTSGESSLVLVTLDTVRADATGSGGAPRAHTPHLDRLARGGVQWETGLAASPLTLPSHASLLTGLDPPAHGARDNETFRLADDVPTLAAALRLRGFETAGFVAAFPLKREFGLARGFETFDDDLGELPTIDATRAAQRSGDAVLAAVSAWLPGARRDRRQFVWVHFFDAHAPYEPLPALARATGGAYPGDVALADRHLGALLRLLELDGREAWVIVQADHGESLGEHGEDTHAIFVYEATTRVPAVVWPAPAGERPGLRRGTFRHVDLAATAFDLLGLDPEAAPGRGASALDSGERPAYLESLHGNLRFGWSALRAVRDGAWKYIEATEPELYDLRSDPGETENLHDAHPEIVSRLAAVLEEVEASERTGDAASLDESDRRALESLGYVTGGPGVGVVEARPDPKRMMPILKLLNLATSQIAGGDFDGAGRSLRRAISLDPENKEAHVILGKLHVAAGRDELAIDWMRRALELPPEAGNDDTRLKIANAYLRLGRTADAVRELEVVLETAPSRADAWYNYGVALVRAGETGRAADAWRRASELDPGNETYQKALSSVSP